MKKFQKIISTSLVILLTLFLALPNLATATARVDIHTIDEAIDKASEYMINKDEGVISEWEAIGLAKAGKEVPASYQDWFHSNFQSQIIRGLDNGRIKITDIERLTIAAVAIEKDPRNIDGINLIELIYNSPDHRSGADTMTFQGNNGPIFALIALDTKSFDVPDDARWTRQSLVNELLRTQNKDGSWNLNEAFGSPSVDITAMALIGLSPYKDQPLVEEALDKATNWLSSIQKQNGGFDGGDFVGGITSEAASQVIIGLTSYGIDPTSELFTKSGNHVISHLLSFQADDGGFKHTAEDTSSNSMATEQALQALVAYKLFLEGNGPLYHFGNHDKDPTPPVEDVTPEISVKGLNNGEIITSSEITFTVSAKAGDQQLEPIVQLNGKDLTANGGQYTVQLNKGENKISIHAESDSGKVTSVQYIVIYQATNTIEVGEALPVASYERIVIAGSNTQVVLPDNIPQGTTLLIEKSAWDHDGLTKVGDAFNFIFQHPENKQIAGVFTLTMGVYDNSEKEKTGVYHYNEETGKWQYAGGWGQMKDDVIIVDVNHFSTYGVFMDTEGPTNVQLKSKSTTNNQVTLDFSAEDPSGIASYDLYRDGKLLQTIKGNEHEFIDTDVQPGKEYLYEIISTDKLGNESEKTSLRVKVSVSEETVKEDNDNQDEMNNGNHDNDNLQGKTDKDKETTLAPTDTNQGDKLPATATNIYNFFFIGTMLVMIGMFVLYVRKKHII
ncbi:hypothetical protein ACFFIS_15140 [Virgibacillus soli]|uniref:Fibronectin type-III domain-containing protein n=1 Tax=Paracerasibacillus soli TaxID=480284 RepID=A0ABU5CVH1_9BACI|nr:hypothetical protein [Virgibacillus soli]MDY0410240.1 hypothetical protein [Virgibacillus soli]